MIFKLMLLFTLVPLIELSLLVTIGQKIGLGATLTIVILTGILGAYLAREQGFKVISKIQSELSNGRIPADSVIDGVLVLAGGLLLITPGFITDAVGFSVLIPISRALIKEYVKRKFRQKIDSGQIHTSYKVD